MAGAILPAAHAADPQRRFDVGYFWNLPWISAWLVSSVWLCAMTMLFAMRECHFPQTIGVVMLWVVVLVFPLLAVVSACFVGLRNLWVWAWVLPWFLWFPVGFLVAFLFWCMDAKLRMPRTPEDEARLKARYAVPLGACISALCASSLPLIHARLFGLTFINPDIPTSAVWPWVASLSATGIIAGLCSVRTDSRSWILIGIHAVSAALMVWLWNTPRLEAM